jgi:hypothetical protein
LNEAPDESFNHSRFAASRLIPIRSENRLIQSTNFLSRVECFFNNRRGKNSMTLIEIQITNWEKFNPKRDQNSYSWLRLNNDFLDDQRLYDLSPEQKLDMGRHSLFGIKVQQIEGDTQYQLHF